MMAVLYRNPNHTAYLLLVILAVVSTLYNAFLPLHGDEAYYWVWSHHLQGGYFDHAPLVAWMIAASNMISESEWGVRLSSVVSMSVAGLYVYKLAQKLTDDQTALNALFIFLSVILVHAGYTIITPDSPLVLFWSLALYYGYVAIFENRTVAYVLLGLSLGLMMLGKYTAILFPLSLLLFAVIARRSLFADWRVYAVMIIAALTVTPMLWWNYTNDWISITFQLGNGATDEWGVGYMLEFLAGQFAIYTPIFAGILFVYLVKERVFYSEKKLFYVALTVLVPLLFFLYKALSTKLEINYAATSYIGGSVLTAIVIERYRLRRLFAWGIALALFLSISIRISLLSHLHIVQNRMYGNKEAVARLATHMTPGDALYGGHLTIAALMQYYLPGHPDTQVLAKTRPSQYDLWIEEGKPKGGLFLCSKYCSQREKRLKQTFGQVVLIDTLSVSRGLSGEKRYFIYRVSDAKLDLI